MSKIMNNLSEYEHLRWAIRMVLQDFEDNDSPCLNVAAVNAIQSTKDLVALTDNEKLQTTLGRIQERAQRVLEGEDWDLARYCEEVISGLRL